MSWTYPDSWLAPARLPAHLMLSALGLLIGVLSVVAGVETLSRPQTAQCVHFPAKEGEIALACGLDGGEPHPLAIWPEVKPRRAGRNTYNDATLAFRDGYSPARQSESLSVAEGARLNEALRAAAAGGAPVEVPLSTGRWILWLSLAAPLALIHVVLCWRTLRRRGRVG